MVGTAVTLRTTAIQTFRPSIFYHDESDIPPVVNDSHGNTLTHDQLNTNDDLAIGSSIEVELNFVDDWKRAAPIEVYTDEAVVPPVVWLREIKL